MFTNRLRQHLKINIENQLHENAQWHGRNGGWPISQLPDKTS